MVARVAYFPLQELSWIGFWPMHHFSSFLSTPTPDIEKRCFFKSGCLAVLHKGPCIRMSCK